MDFLFSEAILPNAAVLPILPESASPTAQQTDASPNGGGSEPPPKGT